MPYQAWVANVNSPGEGAGSAVQNVSTATDASPAPQFLSQTYGPMYVGQRWRFRASATASNTATPTLNLGIYYGGVAGSALCTSGAITTTTAMSSWFWKIEVDVEIRTLGSSGTAYSTGWIYIPTSATAVTVQQMNGTAQTVTINTTTNSALTVGATWSAASASNTLTLQTYSIEQMN